MTKKNALRREFVNSLSAEVAPAGCIYDSEFDRFQFEALGAKLMFQLKWIDIGTGWKLEPDVGVRIDLVEDIFHRTSEFLVENQPGTVTIGGQVGTLMTGTNTACEFLVDSATSLSSAVNDVASLFHSFAFPYFERYRTIEAIDLILNEEPDIRSRHRGIPWFRASSGIIVAKLVKRTNYDYVRGVYLDTMMRTNRGFYVRLFEALLKDLEGMQVL